jgi:hypothetical protein
MIHTQGNRGQPKLTDHPLAAYMDVWRFMTIKAVEEQAIGTWNIGNRGHAIRLKLFQEMHDVSHSIADLFSETTPELGNALFGFSSSDLAPNAQAHLLPEAGAARSKAEAGGSQVQRRVRCCADMEERPIGSLAQEPCAYGQSRGVMPFSCAYLAADASTSGRTSA